MNFWGWVFIGYLSVGAIYAVSLLCDLWNKDAWRWLHDLIMFPIVCRRIARAIEAYVAKPYYHYYGRMPTVVEAPVSSTAQLIHKAQEIQDERS